MADVLAAPQHAEVKTASSLRTLSLVALAHWVSHFNMLVLPMLFPFLKAELGVGYVELGFAMTVFAVTTALVQTASGEPERMLDLSGVAGGGTSEQSNAERRDPTRQPSRAKTGRIRPEGGKRPEPGGSPRGS